MTGMKDDAKVQFIKTMQSLGMLICGCITVIILTLSRTIQDGETIAALSAVFSASMGTHALNRKPNTDD